MSTHVDDTAGEFGPEGPPGPGDDGPGDLGRTEVFGSSATTAVGTRSTT
ncbi:hypothetical protein ACFQRB_14455 [Halobaculum litoreum]|uniref:Uncharacterized protein n=1 Tax=Halobaculum litoreum TaxID=3031998 RepID=A0ABD5XRV7_9EURY